MPNRNRIKDLLTCGGYSCSTLFVALWSSASLVYSLILESRFRSQIKMRNKHAMEKQIIESSRYVTSSIGLTTQPNYLMTCQGRSAGYSILYAPFVQHETHFSFIIILYIVMQAFAYLSSSSASINASFHTLEYLN
jgi:hypothetical protein